ncbi:bifunctional hydroxymethylpyrimidine kinase/phosphomethylpyrimidine kinase [Methanocaldococcus sp.]
MIKKALTIAGSDSSSGAGIEADLKTFSSFGVYGLVVVTAVTAQNTKEIRDIQKISPKVVKNQILAVVEDIGVDAIKTGMLYDKDIIKEVRKVLENYDYPLVVDPVMVSKSNVELLKKDAIKELDKLIKISTLVTPNKDEAEVLSGKKINNLDDAVEAAKILYDKYETNILIKGGHLEKPIDILFDGKKIYKFEGEKVRGCTHGTGCSFSAAITSGLAKGFSLTKAIERAKKFITLAIEKSYKIGSGHCPVNQLVYIEEDAERWRTYIKLKKAVNEFINLNLKKLIPEVGSNFVYSLPYPYNKSIYDVAGVRGRIVKADRVVAVGDIEFGASNHLARAILTYMKFYPEVRSCLNIKYSEEIIEKAKRYFKVSFYDRRKEPEEIKKIEGSTIPWGIEEALKNGKADIIYHLGDVGKEPMILVFGRDPEEVLIKLKFFIQ